MGKKLLIGCGGLFLLVIVIGSIGAVISGFQAGFKSAGVSASVVASPLVVKSTPKPTPSPTPKPTVDTAGIAVYASYVSTETTKIGGEFSDTGTKCSAGDIQGCRNSAQVSLDDLKSFRQHLNTLPVPTQLVAVDTQLKAAVDTYIKGVSLEIKGIDDSNTDEMSQGTAIVQQGTEEITKAGTLLDQAVAAMK